MGINREDFYYFLHKTLITDPTTIEDIFNNGLKSRFSYSIHSTMKKIDDYDLAKFGLEDEIKSYIGNGDNYNAAVVIKIPKKYFSDRIHSDGNIDPPIPLFREYYEQGWSWNSIFTPKLIQGIYCRDIDKAFTNPNFNPIYDPSGCQFSDEQLNNFQALQAYNWYDFAKERQRFPFERLYENDKNSNIWDDIITHYSRTFDIKPSQMTTFKLSESDKELFKEKAI